jgi:hypothetical protein
LRSPKGGAAFLRTDMKNIAITMACGLLLSGCVAYAPYDDGVVHYPAGSVYVSGTYHHGDRDYDRGHRHHRGDGHHQHRRGDRDRDGVPNRYDYRPDNPYRY